MKKYLYILLLSLSVVFTGYAQSADSIVYESADTLSSAARREAKSVRLDGEALALQADSAYSNDNFVLAEQLYISALKRSGSSTILFYNLGNVYYRLGNLGKAIVNYERALKLDPTNSDAKTNLEFVNSRIADKQIDSGSFMLSLWTGVVGFFRADTWAIISLILISISIGAVAGYIFSSSVAMKKVCFFGGLALFLLTLISGVISFSSAKRMESNNAAIVLSPAAQLSTSPREARNKSEQAFLLHEGTKVEIIDSISNGSEGKWYEITVGHGERAWINSREVEKI